MPYNPFRRLFGYSDAYAEGGFMVTIHDLTKTYGGAAKPAEIPWGNVSRLHALFKKTFILSIYGKIVYFGVIHTLHT